MSTTEKNDNPKDVVVDFGASDENKETVFWTWDQSVDLIPRLSAMTDPLHRQEA